MPPYAALFLYRHIGTRPVSAESEQALPSGGHPASGSPPTVVHAPIGEVTVGVGDNLTTIGARTSRTWEQLAGYNHLPNPNLILAGQVLTIPPVDYVAPSLVVTVSSPAPTVTSPAPTVSSQPSTVTSQPATVTSSTGMPASWQATAMCEEGGANDPNYGYFGIKEWNGFDGYPSAGAAPLSVQLAWEAQNIGAPPDAPGECHSY